MRRRGYIAVDLGAESGRVFVGSLSGEPTSFGRLELHEAHRFTHEPQQTAGVLRWDIDHIWGEVIQGLTRAAEWSRASGIEPVSVGVDTWGVDFALLDGEGGVMEPPRSYRDARHATAMEFVRERLGAERLYGISGVQEASINTLVQLGAAVRAGDATLTRAKRLLFMPSLFHFMLSGVACNEVSIASTSQMLDAESGGWSDEILGAMELKAELLGEPVVAGSVLGGIRHAIAARTGLPESLRVVAPATHDTACAVAAVPARGNSWAYLSSGTWSLLGAELDRPILTAQARRLGFTNERGIGRSVRFQKNLSGLWLVQEVRRDLERLGGSFDYEHLVTAAEDAEPFRTRIDASDSSLASPGGIIAKLGGLAARVGDPAPVEPGDLVRCCLEGIAMDYRRCVEELEKLLVRKLDVVYIVGGGSRNALLCQMTADATGKRVLAGPVEATAAGNVLVQAMADGSQTDAAAIRRTVAASTDLIEYIPREVASWSEAYGRHRRVWGHSS